MENKDNLKACAVASSIEFAENSQKELDRLKEELEYQRTTVEYYKAEAEKYERWWREEVHKRERMKEDIKDIQNLTNKLIERW